MQKNNIGASPKPFNCADQATITWLQRAEICVDLLTEIIPAVGKILRIADIGCGDQKLLATLNSRPLTFTYAGYDLLPQSSDVTKFDVQSDSLPCQYDVAVMMGVIEYLVDLSAVLSNLARRVPYFVVSHVIRQNNRYSADRLTELGWVNHLSASDLVSLLRHCGFSVIHSRMTPDGKTLVLMCHSVVQAALSK